MGDAVQGVIIKMLQLLKECLKKKLIAHFDALGYKIFKAIVVKIQKSKEINLKTLVKIQSRLQINQKSTLRGNIKTRKRKNKVDE